MSFMHDMVVNNLVADTKGGILAPQVLIILFAAILDDQKRAERDGTCLIVVQLGGEGYDIRQEFRVWTEMVVFKMNKNGAPPFPVEISLA